MKYLGRIGRYQFTLVFKPHTMLIGVKKRQRYFEMGELYFPFDVYLPMLAIRVTVSISPQRWGDDE